MRVLYLTDAPRVGGAERYLVDVVGATARAGHEAIVVAPQEQVLQFVSRSVPEATVQNALSDNYATAGGPLRRAIALASQLSSLRRLLAGIAPDVMHVNNGGYPGSDLCRIAVLAARGTPTVMSVHSAPWSRATSRLARTQAVVDRLIWRSIDVVHATSDFVAAGLTELRGMPPALGRVIPYGVGDARQRQDVDPGLRGRLLPAGATFLVGMVSGTADAGKGHDVFVDALRRLDHNVAGVVLGPTPDALARDALRGEGRLHVVGPVPHEEVHAYLGAIDALVVPSVRYESLPLVVLEAMSAGTPVIASRLSGIPEAVRDGVTGHLFEPGDVEGLIRILASLAASPETVTVMGADARRRWQERFSLDAQTTATLSLYDGLAAGRRSA